MDETTRIQHGAVRGLLRWPVRPGDTKQLKMNIDHLELKLLNFKTIRDSMLVNTAYAFIHNLDPQVKTLFKNMAE